MTLAQRLAFATAGLTLLLIGIGAYVRATGSGLGCPDWPTCHGGVVPPGSRHSIIEYSHRFTASLVGLMVIAVAIAAWRGYRHVPAIMWTAIAVVPLVGFQGILGAITVKQELPPEVVGTHLVTAMVVFSLELFVAFGMALQDRTEAGKLNQGEAAARRTIGLWALAAIAWLTVVVWVGGYMAESGATTACSGWPACNGSILPGNNSQEITHMAHRFLAGGLVFLIAPYVVFTWRRRELVPWAAPAAVLTASLYLLQVAVGAVNVLFTFPDLLTVSHTMIAASVWGSLASAAALAFFAPVSVPREQPMVGRGLPA